MPLVAGGAVGAAVTVGVVAGTLTVVMSAYAGRARPIATARTHPIAATRQNIGLGGRARRRREQRGLRERERLERDVHRRLKTT